jgi:hypothetical protein
VPRYRIVVEALPDDVPEPVRLRRWLKLGLRAFGFRCLDCTEEQQKMGEIETAPEPWQKGQDGSRPA